MTATTTHGCGGAGRLVSGYQLAREFLRDNRFGRADPFCGPMPHNERTPT